MTAGQVLTEVRRLLSDVGSSRWSDPVLLRYLSNAVRFVAGMRADLLLQEDGTITEVSELNYGADEIGLPEDVRGILADLTASSALQEDSDDRVNMERAAAYEDRAVARLVRGSPPVR